LRIKLPFAVKAPAARDVMINRNSIPRGKPLDCCARPDDNPCRLMAEYPGRRYQAVLDLLDVRAAHATGVDANEYLAVRYPGHGQRLNVEPVWTSIYRSLHFQWDLHRPILLL
jgi:hypothetical protein